MPIQAGDFTIALSISGLSGNIETALGHEVTLSVIFNNNSLTDALYNLKLNLELPDGISFVNASTPETSSTIDSNFKNLVEFINIKDLYPNELGFSINITLKSDEYYRSSPQTQVDFFSVIPGIRFSASADTKPRGNLDSGNTTVTTLQTSSFEIYRYYMSFVGPTTYLKGAGDLSNPPTSANEQFEYNIQLLNNTLEESEIDLNINLANGIRYIGDITPTGTDSPEFTAPTISIPTPGSGNGNNSKVSFANKKLSAGSDTNIKFKAAIWNNLTENELENSGQEILHGSSLLSSAELSSDQYASVYANAQMSALMILITKALASAITDWNVINQYTITYATSIYLGIDMLLLRNIIDDGMTFNVASPSPDQTTINPDGTTELVWDLGNIASDGTGSISFSTTTDELYNNLAPVYVGDKLTSTLNATFNHPNSGEVLVDSIAKTVSIPFPTLSKTIIGYYYNDLTEKSTQTATIGDYVKFRIEYDGQSVTAPVKSAKLYDYPPLNMVMTNVPNYSLSTNFPSGVVPEIVPENGVLADLGEVTGSSNFYIDYTIKVTEVISSNRRNNLAKLNVINYKNESTSIPVKASINFGTPNLKYTHSISNSNCLKLNNTYQYTLVLTNLTDASNTYITDAFNLNSITEIPNIFTIDNIDVTGTGDYLAPTITNNIIDFEIQKLPLEESLTLTIDLTTSSLPLLGESYKIQSNVDGGTSQSDINSEAYTELSASKSKNLSTCNLTISKNFSSDTTNIGNTFITTSVIEVPEKVIAYNFKLIDTLVGDLNKVNNVFINSLPTTDYSINNGLIEIPLENTLDTTLGATSFIITYENSIESISTDNNEEIFTGPVSINWTDSANTESFDKNTTASITLLEPEISVEKFQRNYTTNTAFYKKDLKSSLEDLIVYKFRISNTGKAPAFEIILKDILDTNLTLLQLLAGEATFNRGTNTITFTHEELAPNYYIEVAFLVQVNNDDNVLIALNTSDTTFKTNIDSSIYKTITSNTTNLLNDIFSIEKTQKNLTTDTEFSEQTLRVLNGQTFQYKIKLTNHNESSLNNIVITDTFPLGVDFIEFEPFTDGTVSRNDNNITLNIPSLQVNESIELIYTLTLNSDSLKIDSSSASATFEVPSEISSYTLDSNTIYTKFSALGKGFDIY